MPGTPSICRLLFCPPGVLCPKFAVRDNFQHVLVPGICLVFFMPRVEWFYPDYRQTPDTLARGSRLLIAGMGVKMGHKGFLARHRNVR